jgi:hypothetical protein
MTEGNATVHTTTALILQCFVAQVQVDLIKVLEPFYGIPILGQFPLRLHKSSWLTHY